MTPNELDARGEGIRAAWNSQDVERVLATYAEEFRYTDPDTRGAIVRRPGGREEVEIDGVDLVLFDGERIASHEIYFDRVALAPLFTAVG